VRHHAHFAWGARALATGLLAAALSVAVAGPVAAHDGKASKGDLKVSKATPMLVGGYDADAGTFSFGWQFKVKGGAAPFHTLVDYGRGVTDESSFTDGNLTAVATVPCHAYEHISAAVSVTITDSKGATATKRLSDKAVCKPFTARARVTLKSYDTVKGTETLMLWLKPVKPGVKGFKGGWSNDAATLFGYRTEIISRKIVARVTIPCGLADKQPTIRAAFTDGNGTPVDLVGQDGNELAIPQCPSNGLAITSATATATSFSKADATLTFDVTVKATGGVAPYTYSFDGGVAQATATASFTRPCAELESASMPVGVTDAATRSATASADLPACPAGWDVNVITAAPVVEAIYQADQGAVTLVFSANATGGEGSLSYWWSVAGIAADTVDGQALISCADLLANPHWSLSIADGPGMQFWNGSGDIDTSTCAGR